MKERADKSYPVHDLLKRRWSTRAFSDKPVEQAKLVSIFEAARLAPSSFNEQPWSFIVATTENKEERNLLKSCIEEANYKWIQHAPVLVLTVAKTHFERNRKMNIHALHDVGLAVGNLVLQATSLGLLVQQFGGFDTKNVRKVFHIPQEHDPVSILAIGYPEEGGSPTQSNKSDRPIEPNRKSLREFVFSGAWGKPSTL